MVRAAPETDITTAAMPEDVPPPPAYTAVATAPTQGNRPELPVRVRNHKLSWRECSFYDSFPFKRGCRR